MRGKGYRRGGVALALAVAAICGPAACRQGSREASQYGEVPGPASPSADAPGPASPSADAPGPASPSAASLSKEVAERCLMRGQLALTSPSTMVQAVSELHCALQGPPELAVEAHRGLAIAYAELGEREKAIRHLELCLRIAPSSCDRADIERRLSRSVPPSPKRGDAAPGDRRP